MTGTPKCIFKNFSSPTEKINTSSGNYSAALFEAFKYFGGYSTPAHAAAGDDLGGTPVDTTAGATATHFGPVRYSNQDAKIDQYRSDSRYFSAASAVLPSESPHDS